MAGCGADVAVTYRTHGSEAEEVAAEVGRLGRRAAVFEADVAARDQVEATVEGAVSELGRLDIVVANAAYSKRESFLDTSLENMQRTLDVCLWGAFHVAQVGARQMVRQGEGGHILFISSVHAVLPVIDSTAYNAAKAGLNHMTATIAAELTPHRIRVNAIEPGWIDTPGEREFFTEEELREGGRDLPWGRLGTSEDIGRAAAFLSSNAADYITGTVLRVDGGYVLRQ